VPPLDEQRTRAAAAAATRARHRALIQAATEQIALLHERKQALIAAAVKGELALAREIAEEVS
jgi:hypothetical protein